ncbi:MAG: class I SAM-dependent methyltransferase [Bacteroidota bacterium]|nr:class I SAM-dependent methyltransferase [Bacteroidota bacterium]
MKEFNKKEHWEKIYSTKELKDVSWFQPVPETSIDFIRQFNVPKTAHIIDIGGGDSLFADHLLELGYENITVLDISATALEKAKQRLGEKAARIKWIVADASTFVPAQQYDFWHDRAAFHFFTKEKDIANYISVLKKGIKPSGHLILGTFSEQGPKKCSGIEIRQYTEISMAEKLKKLFNKIKCITVDHKTPFDTIQNFIFCSFQKKTELA